MTGPDTRRRRAGPRGEAGLPRRLGSLLGAALAGVLLAGTAVAEERQTEAEREANCREGAARLDEALAAAPAPAGAVVVYTWKETFCPRALVVPKGARLHVVNVEKRTSHSIWFRADGRAESERFMPGESVEVNLDLAAGEHEYVCGPHPWMTGRVTVTEGKP